LGLPSQARPARACPFARAHARACPLDWAFISFFFLHLEWGKKSDNVSFGFAKILATVAPKKSSLNVFFTPKPVF
jgi:hypothetical protein